MSRYVNLFLAQPARPVAGCGATDFPVDPGVYAWYRSGRLFYVGETHRGLRSRVWGNHLNGNARGSTLRNKVAKSLGFDPTGLRTYGAVAEEAISAKLRECEVRLLALERNEVSRAQADLIAHFNPPMNDHPGERPRWNIDEVRRILGVTFSSDRVPVAVSKEAKKRSRNAVPPDWTVVEGKIEELARTQAWFPTVTGRPNRITNYEADRRVLVQTSDAQNWVQVSWIKHHWQTLISRGEVSRDDVLYPGRRSAFMLALFRQIPGVSEIPGPPVKLRLERQKEHLGA
jgi:hypothetical protein